MTPIPGERYLPTLTVLPTLEYAEVQELLATPPPRPTLPVTWTPAPTLPPTRAIEPPGGDTAPIATATPDVDRDSQSRPPPSGPQRQPAAQTQAPTSTATRVQSTVAVRQDLLREPIAAPVSQPVIYTTSGASVATFTIGPGHAFTFGGVSLSGGTRLFVPNPHNPDSWARTDHTGMLRYRPIGAAHEAVMTYSPWHVGFQVSSIEVNKNRIMELDWSSDGQKLSFRIDPPPGTDDRSAGVYYWQPEIDPTHGAVFQLARDCPTSNSGPCHIVRRPSNGVYHWKTIAVEWSPVWESPQLLLTFELPAKGRNAVAIINARRDPGQANNPPDFKFYDYGHYSSNGEAIVLSGRDPSGRVIISEVAPDFSGKNEILDGSERGLWLRNAVRHPGGGHFAFGRPGAPGSGPVALYDGEGRQRSDFIGGAAPDDIRWFPDYSHALVATQGRQYAVSVPNGAISDVTSSLNNLQLRDSEAAALPEAVIRGSGYAPGQQLRVAVPILNVRTQPTTDSAILEQLRQGDYVAIIAGPHLNEGYRWLRAQTSRDTVGWLAGVIDGEPTIR